MTGATWTRSAVIAVAVSSLAVSSGLLLIGLSRRPMATKATVQTPPTEPMQAGLQLPPEPKTMQLESVASLPPAVVNGQFPQEPQSTAPPLSQYIIEGKAVDATSGDPAAHVPFNWLRLNQTSDSQEPNCGRTAVDGSFRVAVAVEGAYSLMFAVHSTDPECPWTAQTVRPVATGTRTLLVPLHRGFSLTGQVSDDQGRPLSAMGARIARDPVWRPADYFMPYQSYTKDDGSLAE